MKSSEENQRHENFKFYLKNSKEGSKRFQFLLAKCFENGVGTEKNSDEAFIWYLKSAEQGLPESQCIVGDYYYFGRGIAKDLEKAFDYYTRSAEQGNFDAKKGLGIYYSISEDVEEDFEKAYDWFKRAYSNFTTEHPNYLIHIPNNTRLANQCLCVDEKILETPSITKLKGGGYKYDWKSDTQIKKAIFWYEKAVDLGSGDAMFLLGKCYKNRTGLNQNISKALNLFEKALDNNPRQENYVLLNIADILNDNKKIKQAVVIYEKVLKTLYSSRQYHYKEEGYYNNTIDEEIQVIEKKLEHIVGKKERLLFFDTETTGVPKNWRAAISDTKNWPRLVQLAWQLYDEKGNLIDSSCLIIKPDKFIIPKEASNVHGITTDKANFEGVDLEIVLGEFERILKDADILIAHNMNFDEKIIGAEFYRLYEKNPILRIKKLCTMEKTTNICKIDGQYGFKWPKLKELHYFLFKEEFENAHNAEADVKATADCYFELKRRTLI